MKSAPALSFLVVDGHSVLFADARLRAEHEANPGRAREHLVSDLRRHQDASGERVVLVFDGRGRTREEPRLPGGVQVFYSGDGTTADALIERLAYRYGERLRLTVATDDRVVREMAVGFGAQAIGVRALFERLAASEREMKGALEELRRGRR